MKNKLALKYYIPLLATLPVIIVCILIMLATLRSDGTSYMFKWLSYGGVFKYVDINVFGISLQNFLMIIGLFVCAGLSSLKRSQYGFKVSGAVISTFVFFLFSYLGAKLLAGVEHCIDIGWTEWDMSGQSLFGVLYISMLAIPLMAKIFKKNTLDMFDYFAPTCPLLLTFIRLGCFFAGCCGAKETAWGNSPVKLPVQLYEVICDLVILYFCLVLDRPGIKGQKRGSGIWPFMMVTYCGSRFMLEFIRSSKLYFAGLSLSQLHALLFFIVGIAWYCALWDREAKEEKNAKKKKVVHKK